MINKKSLTRRMQASYETKGSGGSGKKGIFNYRASGKEISFFKPVEGKNRINIIPYTIKTKNHPLVRKGEFEVGDMDYVMDFYVHKNIGASESTVLCLKNTFGKPCPICEQMAMLNKSGREDDAKLLKPSRRVAYNVEDLKEPGKVKIFETSHYLFEKELIDEAREDDGFVDFADPDDGKEIKFRGAKKSIGKTEYMEFKSFSFDDREEPLDSELVENAISFDEIMEIPSYGDVEKLLYGSDESDDEHEEKKSLNRDDDDEDFEVPTKKAKKVELEDDEPEEKPLEKKQSKCSGKCPFGHNFHDDCEEYPDDCDNCDCWDKCCHNQ